MSAAGPAGAFSPRAFGIGGMDRVERGRMTRKIVDVAVIIPDASPVLTLARIGRIDLLGSFSVPIQIVDQVYYEITRPENDPSGAVAEGLRRLHNRLAIIETNVGVGFQVRRGREPKTPSGNLGEIAVDEYATTLAQTTGPGFVPLVLFEDPDVLNLRIARLKDVHLLNTTAWLLTLHREGLLPEGLDLVERINSTRKTPMVPFEKVGLTRKLRSTWLRRSFG
jgi:hypothetical protein